MSGLDVKKMSAYAADNASVNYGKHNSVYQKLKLAQKDVLAANCLAHILHNATRYAASNLDIDIENVVLKVYSHFSISASRTAQLKEFCEFVEVEECNLLRHVVTRWLSLLPSIDRILKCWRPLTSYFQSLEYSDAVQACSLKDIDMDGLYEEYGMVEAILSSSEMEGCHSEERYLKLFSKAEVPLVNLRKSTEEPNHIRRVYTNKIHTTPLQNEQ
ncbi:hypothetical protein JOQ06_018653, partial [Pogonophryne albipinna]